MVRWVVLALVAALGCAIVLAAFAPGPPGGRAAGGRRAAARRFDGTTLLSIIGAQPRPEA